MYNKVIPLIRQHDVLFTEDKDIKYLRSAIKYSTCTEVAHDHILIQVKKKVSERLQLIIDKQ